jgi:hypothetical protein
MEYDEIRISTRREIAICRGWIKKLETLIETMGKKYNTTSADFLTDLDPRNPPDGQMTRWHDSCCTLKRWKERLSAHLQILQI